MTELPEGRFGQRATVRFVRATLWAIACVGIVGVARAADDASIAETKLEPRSGPRGSTMFATMAPEQTGIVTENNFSDPKMWEEHEKEFALGETGTGVAIGDYDGDGRPDVFVVSKTERCRLFRNLGGWKFEDVTDKAGLVGGVAGWTDVAKSWVGLGGKTVLDAPEFWRQGAAFADVNNDGRLDLYVCRFGAPNLLYINQGDGTFKEEAGVRGLALIDASGMAAFCDYDRDGWLDVYVHTAMRNAAAHPSGERDHLFHNNGDGTFTEVTDRAGISGETVAHSATWWDYDDDGWPDLYVANDFAPRDKLYHNNRDGTFTDTLSVVVPHTPYSSMGADIGDVNNDGRIDFFAPDMAASTHEKDHRGMAYSRSTGNTVEIVTSAAPQYSRNMLYLSTGTGRCLEAAYLAGIAATDWTWSPRLEDLDNDGWIDLFVTNGMAREFQNADLRDRTILAESPAERVNIMRSSPLLREANLTYRNLGDLRFEEVGRAWGLDETGVSFGAAFGDLDGDGDLDLVYSNYQKGVTVLRNDSDTGHRLIVALRGTRSNRYGVGATVRIETSKGVQVRQLVLARGYLSTSEPILHFGLGEVAVVKRLSVVWPSGERQVFTDLAVDRKYTITEPASARLTTVVRSTPESAKPLRTQFEEVSSSVGLALLSRERGALEAQALMPFRLDRRGPAAAAGDLDGDGEPELIIGGTPQDPLRIVNRGKVETLDTGGGDDGPMVIFDADGDGANDLLVTKAVAAAPRLFINDRHGGLHSTPEQAVPDFAIDAGAVAVADFDHDGRSDVFVGARVLSGQYPLPPKSALWRNVGGRFVDVTDAVSPELREVGLVTAAVWSDVDGDGWSDLIVACEWGDVRCFHNDRGEKFKDWTEKLGFSAAGTGWWRALACADFNGDGRPDFAVGNVGLNTQYHASPDRPALLFFGSFAPGAPQLVEAYFEGDKLFPWRTRNELGAKIPSILKRYPRNDSYARATLEEILGKDALTKARRFAATELRNGVFLSQPDGTYQFEPWPRIAQIAPAEAIVAGDFDGDGHADIYAVQNSNSSPPSTGRFDGGLSQLLLGDGRGHFTPVDPARSGLIVPGDAKAVIVFDLDRDGRPDFLVTRNDATTLVFRNNGRP